MRDDDRPKASREQAIVGLGYNELTELLQMVTVESLSSLDDTLLPLILKPIQWYQNLVRLLQGRYCDSYRSVTSADGNIQHVIMFNQCCPDAFIMVTINLHTQKAEMNCVSKQLRSESFEHSIKNSKVQVLLTDFINICCLHLWSGLL